jgi:3-oxoacyl-[acyl-carrier-protein] synthase-3
MKLRAVASAIPEHVVSSDEVARWTGAEPDFIRKQVGVDKRAFLSAGETGVDLAAKAVMNLVEQTGISLDSIGLLVYVTQTPDHGIPQNSALLQAAIGASTLAAFDVGLGCSGYPYALTIAKSFMVDQGIKRSIVVTCDPYSKIMRRDDRATVTVFGDAATATLLDEDGTGTIGLGDFGTDGTLQDCLKIPGGRGANPLWSIHQDAPALDGDADDYRLHMKGRGVFNFVMSSVPQSLDRALERNRLGLDDITWFALHQGSLYMLRQLAKTVGIPADRLLTNISRYGNTVSSTIPLLLQEKFAGPSPLNGHVLMSGFGVGLSWGSLVVTFTSST